MKLLRGLAIVPLARTLPQTDSLEEAWPELTFDGPQIPSEFDRDVDDANATMEEDGMALGTGLMMGRSSSRGKKGGSRNIFFAPDAKYIGKLGLSTQWVT